MPRRVLDTNVLINHWGDSLGGRHISEQSDRAVKGWARRLIKLCGTDAILARVYIEFVAGQASERQVALARAYLAEFTIVDQGMIRERDWVDALRIAERVPRDGLRRQLGDCLIRAICNRLGYEVLTYEKRFPY